MSYGIKHFAKIHKCNIKFLPHLPEAFLNNTIKVKYLINSLAFKKKIYIYIYIYF